jgi:hypothetical protein
MRGALVVALGLTLWSGVPPRLAAQSDATVFRFHTDELWLNLHQFLYVLGRHEAGTPDRTRRAVADAPRDAERGLTRLSPDEQQHWRAAVAAYAGGLSKQDAVFDEPLIDLALALVRARSGGLSSGKQDSTAVSVLSSAAPAYRRGWWSDHRKGNEAWTAAIAPLLEAHGGAVLAFITRAYGMAWPSTGYPVHVTGYANWAGAFSTRGDLLVISSRDPGTRGLNALEIVFHEAMHQWDDEVERMLSAEANRQQVRVPPNLSHAMIFYTAGEAVRRVVPDHVPYAEANKMWQPGRNMAAFKPALDAAWKPYLDGSGTREKAIAELVRLSKS